MTVERKEELCNVECNDARMVLLKPASTDDMGEVDTSVSYRPLSNAVTMVTP